MDMCTECVNSACGLATPVPCDGCTSVVYKLTSDDGYDCFDVVVGLNDPAASDSKAGGGDSNDSHNSRSTMWRVGSRNVI